MRKRAKMKVLAKELLLDDGKQKEGSMVDYSIKCSECKYNDTSFPNKPCPPGLMMVTEGKRKAKVFDCAGKRLYHYE